MVFMSRIIEALNDVSSFFYEIYRDVLGWVAPFWYPAGFFYQLSLIFNRLAWYFYDFNTWVDSVAAQVAKILNWSTIKGYIKAWLPDLEAVVSWFSTRLTWFTSQVTTWWTSTSGTVQGWIDSAKQFLQTQINQVNTFLAGLQSSWDSFKGKIPTIDQVISWWGNWSGNVLSVVNTWWNSGLLEVQGLIDSAFTLRQSYWDGWQDVRVKVSEFFTDPFAWLESKFTNWFLGPE